jgi:hypothetical protein
MKNISGIACKWKLSEKFVSIFIINFKKTPKLCYRQHNSNEHTNKECKNIRVAHNIGPWMRFCRTGTIMKMNKKERIESIMWTCTHVYRSDSIQLFGRHRWNIIHQASFVKVFHIFVKTIYSKQPHSSLSELIYIKVGICKVWHMHELT